MYMFCWTLRIINVVLSGWTAEVYCPYVQLYDCPIGNAYIQKNMDLDIT